MIEEIKALKELLDMGAITQEEYDAKKAEILSIPFSLNPDARPDLVKGSEAGSREPLIVETAADPQDGIVVEQPITAPENAPETDAQSDLGDAPIEIPVEEPDPAPEKANEGSLASEKSHASLPAPVKKLTEKVMPEDLPTNKKRFRVKVILTVLAVLAFLPLPTFLVPVLVLTLVAIWAYDPIAKRLEGKSFGGISAKKLIIAIFVIAFVLALALSFASCFSESGSNSSSSSSTASTSSSSRSSSGSSSSSGPEKGMTRSELEQKAVQALYSELVSKAEIYKDLDPGSCKYEIGNIEQESWGSYKVYGQVYYIDKYGSVTKVGGDYSDKFTVTIGEHGYPVDCSL